MRVATNEYAPLDVRFIDVEGGTAHELLAARQVDGAAQLFTRAKDLGYTKRADEALQIWGHDAVLGDVIQAVRRVRPDIIITRFNTLPPNHGHHTASALLAAEAFTQAADSAKYPEQLTQFHVWKPARLLHNVSTWNLAPGADMSAYLKLDVGGYDPLRGRSWTEVAAESRSQHKSQGFGVAAERGPSFEYFQWLAGDKPGKDPLDGLDLTWKRFAGGEAVHKAIDAAVRGFVPLHPERSIPALWAVHAAISGLPDDGHWRARKLAEVEQLLVACAGLQLDVRAAVPTAGAGSALALSVTAVNRSPAKARLLQVTLHAGSVALPLAVTDVHADLAQNLPVVRATTLPLPADTPVTTPYWLRAPADGGLDHVPELGLRGLPEAPPALLAHFRLELGGHPLDVTRAIRHVWTDPVKGEQSRLFEVAPARVFSGWGPGLAEEAKRFRGEVEAAGLSIVALQGWLFGVDGVALFGPAEARDRLAVQMRKVAALAGQLGAGACVYGAPKTRDPGPLTPDAAFASAAEFLRGIADDFAALKRQAVADY